MKYVSLHHHSTFSFMDGYGMPEEHVARAADLGMGAMALTEHGNVSSQVALEKAGSKYGVKPIFGLEAYTASEVTRRKWHMTVLAMNQEGFMNLNRLVTRSWDEGFFQWPTVTGEMLRDHNDGLIVLSGCADSKLACDLLGGKGRELHEDRPDWDTARRTVRQFKRLLGDRYYLEVQQFPELGRTRILNPALAELGAAEGVPIVATSDCHYPMPDDNEMQKILHAAGRGTGTVAAAEAGWEYDIRLTLPTSDGQILERLRGTGLTTRQAERALLNTAEIANRCNVILPKSERLRFPLPQGYNTAKDYIWERVRQGWRYRWGRSPSMRARKAEYSARVKYEMELICSKDFADYFLMLNDACVAVKDDNLPVGPARGSAAASVVCWLLRITEIDPMLYPTMMFERFIDADRADLPDVDLDFADTRRDEVRQHFIMRYGKDNVGNIANYTGYKGKNSIDDVARVYQLPYEVTHTIKELIPERSGGDSRFDDSLEDARMMFPQVDQLFKKYPELAYASRLQGNLKAMSVHSAGLVVSSRPLHEFVATYTRHNVGKENKTLQALSVNKKDAEYLGVLKVDALGLTTMGMIDIALQTIGMTLEELYAVPMDDPKTLAAFKRGDVVGIFQFEGRATRLVCLDVKPENFMELADINALSRPGPLFNGATSRYVEIKHGRDKPEHLHPIVDKYTSNSHYQIVYQEQVLQIIKEMGGFPVSKVADIRRIISQKMGEMSFQRMRDDFMEGSARLHDVDPKLADRIWKQMVTSATYSFNVAHCVSYAMLAFWCMWLKVHHPVAFYKAQLQKVDKDKWPRLIRDAARHGVRVLGPDLVVSQLTWEAADDHTVRAGFEQLHGIGEKTAIPIVEWRNSIPPEERAGLVWEDLLAIKGIGKKTVETLQEAATSDDPFGILRVGRRLNEIRAKIVPGNEHGLQAPTHTSDEIPKDADDLRVTWLGVIKKRNMQDYVENQRTKTGKENAEILAEMKDPHLLKYCTLYACDDGEEDVYLRFNRWKFPKFKDMIEEIRIDEDVVLVTGWKRRGFGVALHVDRMVLLRDL